MIRKILALALFATLPAFAQEAEYRNYAGDYGAQPVAIKPERAIVRFKQGVSDERRAAALRRELYVDPARSAEDTANADTKIVQFVRGISPAEADAAILRLIAEDHVEMASPIISMVEGGGLEAATSEHFYMSFESPVAEQELRGILESEGVEVEKFHEYAKLKRKGFWLKCTESATLHGLAMSNRLYGLFNEKDSPVKPVNAGASFVSLYPTEASEPNDPLFDPTCPGTCPPGYTTPDTTTTVGNANIKKGYQFQGNLAAIHVPEAWDICTGSPHITVADVDTGVDMNYGTFSGEHTPSDNDFSGHPDLNADLSGSSANDYYNGYYGNQWLNIVPGSSANDDEDLNDDGVITSADINETGLDVSPSDGWLDGDDDHNGYEDDFYGWDWVGDDALDPSEDNIPYDDSVTNPANIYGHGTAVAGVIAGITNNETGVSGIAGGWGVDNPGVKIMPLRALNLNRFGTCTIADDGTMQLPPVAQAINYAVEKGAHVISMSLGDFELDSDLLDAVVEAHANDVVLVAAAHNHDNAIDPVGSELPGPTWPARMKEVICTGALGWRYGEETGDTVMRKFGTNTDDPNVDDFMDTNSDGYPDSGSEFNFDNPDRNPDPIQGGHCVYRINYDDCDCDDVGEIELTAWGANFGAQVDLMAPALGNYSTDMTGTDGKSTGDYRTQEGSGPILYNYFNKTSSATPQVAGVAALLLSATLDDNNEPTLTATQVQAYMCLTADDLKYTRDANEPAMFPSGDGYDEIAPEGRDIYTGFGRVNAKAALDLALAPCLEFQDSTGRHAASIDHFGNMILQRYVITFEGCGNPLYAGASDFALQDDSGVYVAVINGDGELSTKGRIYEGVATNLLSNSIEGMFIRDENDNNVAIITTEDYNDSAIEPVSPNIVPAGSVILHGRYFSGWDPDRNSIFPVDDGIVSGLCP